MCPDLSQDVCQDQLSRAFCHDTFFFEKFEQQFPILLSQSPSCASQYKLPDDYAPPVGAGELVHQHQAIPMEMVCDSKFHQLYTTSSSGDNATLDPPSPLHQQLLPCESPILQEIDSSWMKEVMDEFLLTAQDVASFPAIGNPTSHYSAVNLPVLAPPPMSIILEPRPQPTPRTISPLMLSSEVLQLSEDASVGSMTPSQSSSPTPKSLRTRASKRPPWEERSKKVSKWATKACLANTDQVEHVIRERQRRDDMSYKISTLERLLPQGPKRDRASIVHDSVQYVKTLQQRVEELKKTVATLKDTSSRPPGIQMKEDMKVLTIPWPEVQKFFCLVDFHVQLEGGSEAVALKSCRCHRDYLSRTMKAVERLHLDICRCSITKMFDNTFFCVIALKPLKAANPSLSSSSVASSIRSAVQL